MDQAVTNSGRGRPKGSGYDDSDRIRRAVEIMKSQGVSRRRALTMVDPDASSIRRLERKMARAEASHSAYRDRVGTWGLDLVAENVLGAGSLRTFEDLRDRGVEGVDLSNDDLLDDAHEMIDVFWDFFENEEAAAASLRKMLRDSDQIGADEWLDQVERLTLYSKYRWVMMLGLTQAGEGNLLMRINGILTRIIEERGLSLDG